MSSISLAIKDMYRRLQAWEALYDVSGREDEWGHDDQDGACWYTGGNLRPSDQICAASCWKIFPTTKDMQEEPYHYCPCDDPVVGVFAADEMARDLLSKWSRHLRELPVAVAKGE